MAKPKIRTRDKSEGEAPDKKFFETLPGIITAFAALITAIGGCVAIIVSPQILDRLFPQETPTSAPIVQMVTATPQEVFPTDTQVIILPTPTESGPRIFDFQTCPAPCTGQNSTNNFAAGITKIYAQFSYENFKSGIPYTRTWTLAGQEWIRYTCAWDGPESGVEILKFTEPKGLASGTWELKVTVDNKVIFTEELVIVGNGKYWDPAGTINACHSSN